MCGVIVVDVVRSRSTWQGRDAYIHDHCLDILITMRFSINCSTVICSPTLILMLSWEKPLVKPMAPGSIFHHINLPTLSYFLCFLLCFYFTLHLYHKNTKNIILSYLSDLTLVSDREGIDNPFIALVERFLFVCVGSRWLVCSLLLDWYLGSQKLREILTLLCCITLSSSREKPTQAQEVAGRISGAVAGEDQVKNSSK